MSTRTKTIAACRESAVKGLYADRLPPMEPSLQVSATRALRAAVRGDTDATELADIFRLKLHQTGLSADLVYLLKSEGIL